MLLLISVRGSLFSTLGMHETCNFQSNLNNQHVDVGQANMSVLSKSGTVTFVQLYADAPHIHYNQPFTCSLSHPNFKSTLTSKAHTSLRYIRDLSQDVWECLIQGFTADGIIFFPAFKFTDLRSTRRIWWDFKDWIQVSHGDRSILQMSDVASKTLQVSSEIERRSFCLPKHLEVSREHGMPWIATALERLPNKLKGCLLLF